MGQNKFQLVKTTCKRCGCDLMTGNRSLYGADTLKAELGGICGLCITSDESSRILDGQGREILERAAHV